MAAGQVLAPGCQDHLTWDSGFEIITCYLMVMMKTMVVTMTTIMTVMMMTMNAVN